MGLAASQARFLGLTARKSNIEYEGQQVNQQRTALAEEVNSLYNNLASLSVPIAPDATQYYTSNYAFTLDNDPDSSGSYVVKSYYQNADGTYYLNTTRTYDKNVAEGTSVPASTISGTKNNYKYVPVGGSEQTLTVVEDPQKTNMTNLINSTYGDGTIVSGDNLYSYQDTEGATHYFAQSQLDKALASSISNLSYYTSGIKTVSEAKVFENATVKFDANNRMSQVTINDRTLDVDTSRDYDSDAYDAALRDYTMSKDEYNRKVQELNAKTESLQQEDKILEMRLNQIGTEQDELKTELDAVKEILKKNIESTFKTFTG